MSMREGEKLSRGNLSANFSIIKNVTYRYFLSFDRKFCQLPEKKKI